ncbi:MAG: glycosyl transferase [Chloroflexi bacterium]|nr:MAG: glycosyl transferase [Chloroflexota bacterium]
MCGASFVQLKLALVVSWLNQYGGAERVLEAAHALFPDAPVYTSMYDPTAMPRAYRTWDIRVSFMNRLPWVYRQHQKFLPLYRYAFESFDLRGYDVILSITSAFAHGVKKPQGARHLCYCLTPARFLWQYDEYVQNEALGGAARALLPVFVSSLREWDRRAAAGVDEFIAISREIQTRIHACYGRDSQLIYPPVDVTAFHLAAPEQVGDYFLIISRLIPYKRIDLAIEAFNRLDLPLVIAGDGRDRARLEALAKPNVKFLGRVSDAERLNLMARCKAFVFPGQEDFGLAPLEANAAGRPVIAFGGGGALDTIEPGKNGVLFHAPTADALVECLRAFDARAFDAAQMRAHAEKFDTRVFQAALYAQLLNAKTTLA